MRNARLVMPALRLPVSDLEPHLRLAARGVGGFCVFGGDLTLGALLARLQAEAPHRLLFASDLEEGAGQQIRGLSRHPPAAALDPDAAERAGARTAVEARLLGLTMVLAPVCDVLSERRNPIIQGRAFRDPLRAAPRFVRGARAFGLRACAKHFPGHGGTDADSHDALPVVAADAAAWRARDLPPFAACIEAGVDAVMTAHVACPALTGSPTLPATLSRAVMTDLLRSEMGFEGLVVTDALLMEGVRGGRTEAEAALAALEAGCDALLCPHDVDAVLAAVEGVEAEASLARVAGAATPLADPLEAAAGASVSHGGALPVGAGPHAPVIFDLDRRGAADAVARSLGLLAVPAVVIVRSDRAWGGALELPDEAREAAARAPLVILLGPPLLLEGLAPRAWVRAPGHDPLTLAAVARKLRG